MCKVASRKIPNCTYINWKLLELKLSGRDNAHKMTEKVFSSSFFLFFFWELIHKRILCVKIIPGQTLPALQTLFTFTLLLHSSVLLHTPEVQSTILFAQSPVVSFPLLAITLPLSVLSSHPWKPFSFPKLFLQSPCPEVPVCMSGCVHVCSVCVCVCVCACVHVHLCIWVSDV